MKTPRTLGFWIDLAAVAVSVGLCLASIVATGGTAIYLLGFGAVLFVPATVRLASRLTGWPAFDVMQPPPKAFGRQRIWTAVIRLLTCALFLFQLLTPNPLYRLNTWTGDLFVVLWLGLFLWSCYDLVAGIRELRTAPKPGP